MIIQSSYATEKKDQSIDIAANKFVKPTTVTKYKDIYLAE